MTDAVTTSQAAERLDVPLSTLKAWLERLDLPLPVDSRGRRLLDDHALNVLRTVRALRDRDLGYDTIRRKLVEDGVPVRAAANASNTGADPAVFADQVMAAIHQALGEQTFLAQAYAEATREIGRLEEKVATLQGTLAGKDMELRMLARELAQSRGDDHVSLMPSGPATSSASHDDEGQARPAWKFW